MQFLACSPIHLYLSLLREISPDCVCFSRLCCGLGGISKRMLSSGQGETNSTSYRTLRTSHGLLNMFGWGIVLPIGALVARYLRQQDPIWFYSHISIQTTGFLLGAAGVLCGFVLNTHIDAPSITRHKTIGVVVLFFGCLQVIAILVRPDKESKVRKYWNWYHYILGRVLMLLAAVNVFYGVRLAHAGKGWTAGFSVVVALFCIVSIGLEWRLRIRK